MACDTGTAVTTVALTGPLTGTQSATVPGFDPAGCTRAVLVITNEAQTSANPTDSSARPYTVSTGAAPPTTPPTPPGGGSPPVTPSGGTGVTTPTPAVDATPPLISRLRLSRRRFRALRSGPAISVRRGARVRYRLSEKATVRVRFQRRNRNGRFVTIRRSRTHRGRAGANSFRLSGRLAGKALAPGTYRLRLVATDGARNAGVARVTRTFRVVRR